MSVVYALLLRDLAYMVGAVAIEGQASAGTTTTLVDAVNLVQDDDHWEDHRVYIYDGTAQGQERIITAFANATGTLTFPTGTAPGATSKYIILGREWSMAQLRAAFVQALRQERRNLLLPKVDESLTMDTSPSVVYAYNVPSGFYSIQDILREETAGDGKYIKKIDPAFWDIERGSTKKIIFDKAFNDAYGFILDGAGLQLHGQQLETEPTADTSSISVPTGGLLLLAAGMALAGQASQSQNASRYTQAADRYLARFRIERDRSPLLFGSKVISLD